jgi:hypothetical protein
MSANVNLSFEIHDFDRSKADALFAAAQQFLDQEGLRPPEVLLDFLGQEGYLCGYSTGPVIISSVPKWRPAVTERWKAMAERVTGGACRALVKVEYTDEP